MTRQNSKRKREEEARIKKCKRTRKNHIEQLKNTDSHRICRKNPNYRATEQERNTLTHREDRQNPEYRTKEQERDTRAHRKDRADPEYRAKEQEINRAAHKSRRNNQEMRQKEQAKDTMAHQRVRHEIKLDWNNLLEEFENAIATAADQVCCVCAGLFFPASTRKLSIEFLKEHTKILTRALPSKCQNPHLLRIFSASVKMGRPKGSANNQVAKPTVANPPEQVTWEPADPYGIWGSPATSTGPSVAPTSGSTVATTMIGDLAAGNSVSVKGRISAITAIHEFEREGKPGTVFNVTLLDSTGQIAIGCFNLETIHADLEINDVIRISNCYVKQNLSLSTTAGTAIEESDGKDVPELSFDFVPLSEVSGRALGQKFDILAVCHTIESVLDVPAHAPKYKKRNIYVTDQSRAVYCLTIWGPTAINYEPQDYSVLIARGVTLQEFLGKRSINVNMDSTFWANPNLPAASALLTWFKARVSTPFPRI